MMFSHDRRFLAVLHSLCRISKTVSGIAMLLLPFGFSPANASDRVVTDKVTVSLHFDQTAISPNSAFLAGITLDAKPGWHTYWRYPGDSGLPTEIKWALPDGIKAGEINWPRPERFSINGITNYGYAQPVTLTVPFKADATVHDSATISAHVTFLVCADICIPGEADLSDTIKIGQSTPSENTVLSSFTKNKAALPRELNETGHFSFDPKRLALGVPLVALGGLSKSDQAQITFFPYDGTIEDEAPQKIDVIDGMLTLTTNRSGSLKQIPDAVQGILAVGQEGPAFAIKAIAGPVPGFIPGIAPTPINQSDGDVTLWQALLFGVIGGLILNLMPCVFPILSLKVLSVVKSSGGARRTLIHHAIAYTAGILLCFAGLGGGLLILRASGEALGWGFQLQSPVLVAVLAYVMFAMGLSLSGVADFGVGLTGVGGDLSNRQGLLGSFFTGALATIVATPCTAPFMGAATGYALVAPPAAAIAVFLSVGLGLAFPYLMIALVPGLARLMPKPGAWMIILKQIFAFPLYATSAWLIWVLSQQTGSDGLLAALMGLVVVGLGVFILGKSEPEHRALRWIRRSALAATALAGVWLIVLVASSTASLALAPHDEKNDTSFTHAYSPERLSEALAAHQPVFVNLTAAWCLTCLVNERVSLETNAVRDAFENGNILYLKGDWTNQDPRITQLLKEFGRSGVPLYVFYDKSGKPTVLPQLLTVSILLDQFHQG